MQLEATVSILKVSRCECFNLRCECFKIFFLGPTFLPVSPPGAWADIHAVKPRGRDVQSDEDDEVPIFNKNYGKKKAVDNESKETVEKESKKRNGHAMRARPAEPRKSRIATTSDK